LRCERTAGSAELQFGQARVNPALADPLVVPSHPDHPPLVEQRHLRVAQHCAGNGDTLALAARQTHAALAQEGAEALRRTVSAGSTIG